MNYAQIKTHAQLIKNVIRPIGILLIEHLRCGAVKPNLAQQI